MKKLCEFPGSKKWELEYLASIEGLKSSGFLSNRDGIFKTFAKKSSAHSERRRREGPHKVRSRKGRGLKLVLEEQLLKVAIELCFGGLNN